MCKFTFYYFSNGAFTCEHIERAEYRNSAGNITTVNEAEILKHGFPIDRPIKLFSKDCNYTVSSNNLMCIEIVKES